ALGMLDDDARVTVFPRVRLLDATAEQVRDELKAVADSEDGDAELEDARVDRRRALGVDARGSPRQDDGFRGHRLDLLEGDRARLDLAVNALLADAAGDELRVLSPEVEDEDEVTGERQGCPDYQPARGRQARTARVAVRAGVGAGANGPEAGRDDAGIAYSRSHVARSSD